MVLKLLGLKLCQAPRPGSYTRPAARVVACKAACYGLPGSGRASLLPDRQDQAAEAHLLILNIQACFNCGNLGRPCVVDIAALLPIVSNGLYKRPCVVYARLYRAAIWRPCSGLIERSSYAIPGQARNAVDCEYFTNDCIKKSPDPVKGQGLNLNNSVTVISESPVKGFKVNG